MIPRPAPLPVLAVEEVGPYTLLRVARKHLDPGGPGQFFMLSGPTLLPRPMSLCTVSERELGFLIDPIGPGTRALCSAAPGEHIVVTGPLGHGYRTDVERPILVGGGIGIAPLPYLATVLPSAPIVLGFRTEAHASAAEALLPDAEIVLDPVLVTEPLAAALERGGTPLACGPDPMLRAVGRLEPTSQLALEAPMACGHGGCFGCVLEIDGTRKRLCIEGPVLEARRLGLDALPAVAPLTRSVA